MGKVVESGFDRNSADALALILQGEKFDHITPSQLSRSMTRGGALLHKVTHWSPSRCEATAAAWAIGQEG